MSSSLVRRRRRRRRRRRHRRHGGEINTRPVRRDDRRLVSLTRFIGSICIITVCAKERKRESERDREEQQPQRRSPPVGEQRSLSLRIARTPSSLPSSSFVHDLPLRYTSVCHTTSTSSTFVAVTSSVKGGFRRPEPWRAAYRKRRRNRNESTRRSRGNCGGTSGMPGGNSNCCYSVSLVFLNVYTKYVFLLSRKRRRHLSTRVECQARPSGI